MSLCLCVSIGVSHAAESRKLTLDQAIELADQRNRDIQKAREYYNKVHGQYVEERAAALPQITITGSASSDRDRSLESIGGSSGLRQDHLRGEVGFTQALFTWGQVGAAIRAAEVGLMTADDQLRRYRQLARLDVTTAYYDVLLAKELASIARQNLEQKERHFDEAKRKFAVGVATDYDVLAAGVAVDNARPEVIRTENRIQQTKDRLRFLLALDEDADTMGELNVALLASPVFEETFAIARDKRPEIADARHRIGVAEELVTVANAGDKPRLDLKGGYGWSELEIGDVRSDGPAWNLGVYLSFPIFDGLRTRGKVAQARSDLRSQQIDEAKLLDTIALESRDAVNAVREAEEIVKSLSGTATQAERLLQMAEKGYEYGVKIRLEVEDAELNLQQARGNLARGKRDYLVALTKLQWVKGVLGE